MSNSFFEHHGILESSNILNLHTDLVPIFQEIRQYHKKPNSTRSSSHYQGTLLQSLTLATEFNKLPDSKAQVRSMALLWNLAIDQGPKRKRTGFIQ